MAESWKKRVQKYKQLWSDEPEILNVAERLITENGEDTKACTTGYAIAPLLCSYVAWVLCEAKKAGKKRLYFLARDGYYLKKTADILCSEWAIDIECRYLYCSRYAWRGAVYHFDTEEALDYITLGGLEAGFAKMMQRAGLTEQEIEQAAKMLSYSEKSGQRLALYERNQLRKKLSECDWFMDLMKKRSEEKYESAIAYLKQEGLFDDVPYALVDSGWTGSLQKSLLKLLRAQDCNIVPEGYYFGMYSMPTKADAGIYHTFYFSPTKDIKKKVYFNNNLFECVYSAPHGMTIGYEEQAGQWVPVLEQKENPNKERLLEAEPLLLAYIEQFASVQSALIKNSEGNKGVLVDKKRLEDLIYLLMATPTREEAQIYGSYVFCADVIGEEKQTLAGRLSWEELKNGFLFAKIKKRLGIEKGMSEGIGRESAWPEGSIALLPEEKTFWHCALCEYVRLTIETWNNRRNNKR